MVIAKKKIIEKIYDYVFRAKTKEEEWRAWESLKKRDRDINIVPREIKDTGERKYYAWLVNEIQASIDGCPHNILEVGGTCATAFYFRKISPAIQCTLIDNNDTVLEYARWIFGTEPIKIIKGDAKDLPVEDNKYDLVCSSGLIEHFDDGEIKKILSEMRRVIRPNGYVFIAVPNFFSPDLMRIWFKFGKGSERHITIKDMINLYIKELFPNDKLISHKHFDFVLGSNILPVYIEKGLGRLGLGFLNYIIVQKIC
ncbi:MAG: class I SAM-dependent methyltransferase [Patescibacteria group bacterium]|nr:class I SAM-dependent methyltransferase [Patescibacteria group bacterium]